MHRAVKGRLVQTATGCYFLPSFGTGLTLVTGVTAFANTWDTRVDSSGCAPSGCVAENVLDDSLDPTSRWSCSGSLSASGGSCELTLEFEDPQDIVQISMALHRGDQRTRSVDVWVDGDPVATLVSSGRTLDFEPYELVAPQASIIMLRAAAVDDNGWLSITEVGIKYQEYLAISSRLLDSRYPKSLRKLDISFSDTSASCFCFCFVALFTD